MARYYGVPLRNGLPIGLGSAISLRKPGGAAAAVPDPYFEYTTLLLPGNGTNGAQNNTFLDSSTNNFTITRSGNATQGTFSPFSQTGWGAYFNGGTSCLTFTKNASTSSVTLECWFYFTENASIRHILFGGDNSNSANNCQFAVENNGAIFVSINAGASLNVTTSSGVVPKSQWNHIAFVRNGSAWTFYVNGTSVGTGTSAAAINVDRIGDVGAAGATPVGYISNARIVDSAVYTSTFTPSTTPLTAISNTYLLTLQSNRYVDNSGNARAITVSGTTISIQAFSPFNPTAAWSAATYGGSAYFDGSGDRVMTASTSAAFDLGSGNWTIEAWVYFTTVTSYATIAYCSLSNVDGHGLTLVTTSAFAYYINGSLAINSGVAPVAGRWYHVAAVRNSGTTTLYVNGVSTGTTASAPTSKNYYFSSGLKPNDIEPLTGYVSDARVVKGTAVYTANFTPPTAPLTAITNTSILCNFTNAGIYDATSKNDLETVGNAQISTAQSKFGGSSMYFDGTGDWLTAPASPTIALGGGQFTIEAWVYPTTLAGTKPIIECRTSASSTAGYAFLVNSSGNLDVYVNGFLGASTTALSANTWTHVALVRTGTGSNQTTYYINGVASGTITMSGNFTDAISTVTRVGGSTSAGEVWVGYINDLRVTRGYARYTANFTPPTSAFPLL